MGGARSLQSVKPLNTSCSLGIHPEVTESLLDVGRIIHLACVSSVKAFLSCCAAALLLILVQKLKLRSPTAHCTSVLKNQHFLWRHNEIQSSLTAYLSREDTRTLCGARRKRSIQT